jgi:hypothetical protein
MIRAALLLLWQVASQHAGKVAVIADLHGDEGRLVDSLVLAGATDENLNWVMPSGSLVAMTGDFVDRGPQSLEIYGTLEKLQRAARAKGSELRLHLGNHEVMQMQHDFRYVNSDELRTEGGEKSRVRDFSRYGKYGKFVRTFEVMSRSPDGQTLFMHTGYNPTVPGHTFENLKAKGDEAKANDDWESFVWRGDGPVWYRGLYDSCHQVKQLLKEAKANRLVVGHTVQDNARDYCGGRLIAMDVGMSHWMSGHDPAVLVMENGEAKIRTPKGERLLPAPSTVTDGDVEITGQSVADFPFNEES